MLVPLKLLHFSLPNQDFVHYLVSSLREDFNVGLSGKLSSTVCRKRPSALANPKVVDEYIQELFLDHTAAPYAKPPFPEFMCLPIGCVPKKNGKWRLILDLSP